MLKIKNVLRNQSETDEIPIYVRITDGRKTNLIARTRETTFLKYWDTDNGRTVEKIFELVGTRKVEKRDSVARQQIEINKKINLRLQELNERIEIAYKSTSEKITTEWLKNIINPVEEETSNEEIVAYINFYIEKKRNEVNKRTLEKFGTIQKKLIDYKKHYKIDKLFIKDIGIDFKNKFIDLSKKNGYSDSYIQRNIKFVKSICRDARIESIETHHQLDQIASKIPETIFHTLSFDELKKIRDKDVKADYLTNTKQWLLISCYTGQRVSDFMNFTKDIIQEDKSGKYIEFTQKKTKTKVVLPLHDEINKILDSNGGNFPRKISSANYNKYIKKVCELAGIDELVYGGISIGKRKKFEHYPKHKLITSHCGRRSFATNFYTLIPTQLLMSATGHKSEGMFLKYIGKTNNDRSKELMQYFKKIA